jgi:hypothetical protein
MGGGTATMIAMPRVQKRAERRTMRNWLPVAVGNVDVVAGPTMTTGTT